MFNSILPGLIVCFLCCGVLALTTYLTIWAKEALPKISVFMAIPLFHITGITFTSAVREDLRIWAIMAAVWVTGLVILLNWRIMKRSGLRRAQEAMRQSIFARAWCNENRDRLLAGRSFVTMNEIVTLRRSSTVANERLALRVLLDWFPQLQVDSPAFEDTRIVRVDGRDEQVVFKRPIAQVVGIANINRLPDVVAAHWEDCLETTRATGDAA